MGGRWSTNSKLEDEKGGSIVRPSIICKKLFCNNNSVTKRVDGAAVDYKHVSREFGDADPDGEHTLKNQD